MLTGRQETRSAESRADILRAAVEVIATRGCAGATVGRIAESAGLSTAGVFWHFKDKSGLFRAVAQHIKETWVARVKAEALAEQTGRRRLERLVVNHLRLVSSGDPHLRALVLLGLEARGLGEIAAAEFVAELLRMYRGVMTEMIQAGQADGSIAGAVPAERAASVIASALLGAVVQHAATGEVRHAPEFARTVLDALLGPGGS